MVVNKHAYAEKLYSFFIHQHWQNKNLNILGFGVERMDILVIILFESYPIKNLNI